MSDYDLMQGIAIVGVVLIPLVLLFWSSEYDWEELERTIERRDQDVVESDEEAKRVCEALDRKV